MVKLTTNLKWYVHVYFESLLDLFVSPLSVRCSYTHYMMLNSLTINAELTLKWLNICKKWNNVSSVLNEHHLHT